MGIERGENSVVWDRVHPNVNNGSPIRPLVNDIEALGLPRTFQVPVVHVDRCEPSTYDRCERWWPWGPCMNARFVGDMPIVGFATITVCYVTGESPVFRWPPADWPTAECGDPPTQADYPGVPWNRWPDPFLNNTVFLRHRCWVEEPGSSAGPAGCGFFGTSSPRSRLVR